MTLDKIETGQTWSVRALQAPAADPEWTRWLDEIGFVPGERVQLLARAFPGGDPLVVRVGQSTFALRVAEAACIHLTAPANASAPIVAVEKDFRS